MGCQELGDSFDSAAEWYGGMVATSSAVIDRQVMWCVVCDVISLVGADGISGAKTEAASAVVFSPILVPGMGTLYHDGGSSSRSPGGDYVVCWSSPDT